MRKDDWYKEQENLTKYLKSGLTLKQIGSIYGVSKQRIKQILLRFGIPSVGYQVRKEKSVEERSKKLIEKEKQANAKQHPLYYKFVNKQRWCVQHNVMFDLHFSDITWNTHCPVLGIELDYNKGPYSDNSPEMDRVNPEEGYIKDNINIISRRANRIKNNGTIEEHQLVINYMKK